MVKDAFQAYVNANERVNQSHENMVSSFEDHIAILEELVQKQKEFIEFLQQGAGDDEKEIEQQRVTIQELQDKLAGATS